MAYTSARPCRLLPRIAARMMRVPPPRGGTARCWVCRPLPLVTITITIIISISYTYNDIGFKTCSVRHRAVYRTLLCTGLVRRCETDEEKLCGDQGSKKKLKMLGFALHLWHG